MRATGVINGRKEFGYNDALHLKLPKKDAEQQSEKVKDKSCWQFFPPMTFFRMSHGGKICG